MAPRSPWLARLAGDPLRAADLYYQQGRLPQAAAMYRRARRFDQAARVLLEMGDRQGAVALYLEAGDRLRAGEILAQGGDHKSAVQHFEAARAFRQAADSSVTLRQHEKAARFYERAGDLDAAAASFEKAGELEEAIRVLERHSRALVARFRASPDEMLRDQQRQADARRAGILARIGRPAEAADLLLVQGASAQAAELLEKSGEAERAVRSWVAAGHPERALPMLWQARGIPADERAAIFRQCLRFREAAALYTEADRPAEAAECWEAVGENEEAAPLWEAAGEMERAGDHYARAKRWPDAARSYHAASRWELAAEAYAQVPDEAAAAQCWLQAQRPLKAAKSFLAAGDVTAATHALQEIAEGSPDFERATLLLVPLLIEDGVYAGALHRLALLRQEPTETGGIAVERHYWEGRALEGEGRLGDAAQAYQRVLGLRRDHPDAAQRLQAVRERQTRESGVSGSAAVGLVTSRMEAMSSTSSSRFASESPAPVIDLQPGLVLADRYRLEGELGRGGMGRVYKAHDQDLGDTVALKTLLSSAMGATDQERLLREVQLSRRITHPNVVRVFDFGRFPGGLFITMEYLEGQTLDKEIRAKGPLPLGRARDLLAQILAGLEEAHQLRIVHRDLKPSNVFVTSERFKILDFGIARQEGRDVNLTTTGEVLGSPKYMSPEQIQGDQLDGRSDLYSLGILAFLVLAGREPFTGKTPSAIALMHLREPVPDLRELRPELPPEWVALVSRLLEKDRNRRYASAAEARAAVQALPV